MDGDGECSSRRKEKPHDETNRTRIKSTHLGSEVVTTLQQLSLGMAKWNLGTNFTPIHPEIVQKFREKVLWKQKQSTFKNLNPSLCFIHQLWRSGTLQMTEFFQGVLVLDPSRFISHHLWVGNLVGRSRKSWMGSQHRSVNHGEPIRNPQRKIIFQCWWQVEDGWRVSWDVCSDDGQFSFSKGLRWMYAYLYIYIIILWIRQLWHHEFQQHHRWHSLIRRHLGSGEPEVGDGGHCLSQLIRGSGSHQRWGTFRWLLALQHRTFWSSATGKKALIAQELALEQVLVKRLLDL